MHLTGTDPQRREKRGRAPPQRSHEESRSGTARRTPQAAKLCLHRFEPFVRTAERKGTDGHAPKARSPARHFGDTIRGATDPCSDPGIPLSVLLRKLHTCLHMLVLDQDALSQIPDFGCSFLDVRFSLRLMTPAKCSAASKSISETTGLLLSQFPAVQKRQVD